MGPAIHVGLTRQPTCHVSLLRYLESIFYSSIRYDIYVCICVCVCVCMYIVVQIIDERCSLLRGVQA